MASKVVKRFRTQGLLTWLEFRGFHLATQRVNIDLLLLPRSQAQTRHSRERPTGPLVNMGTVKFG